MPVTKLSVSIEEDLAEVVKAAAAEEGVTVSSWLAGAASQRIRNHFLGEAVDQAIGDVGLDRESLDELVAQARADAIITDPRQQ